MQFQPSKQEELLSIYPMCGLIDIRLKKIKKKAIFEVGLSRSGKSTVYNYANNIPLLGVAPGSSDIDEFGDPGATIDVVYEPRILSTDVAQANNGVKSVTLLPNISDRDDYSLVDMPGYLDKRRYNAVIGVSYVIKSAFKIVEECQFVLVIKNDCFRSGQEEELFKTFRGFINMFYFDLLKEQIKIRILQSVTFVIAKAGRNQKIEAYGKRMKILLKQAQDPQYGDYQTVKKLAFIMEYFSEHPEQIYLFRAAQLGEESPPCTLAETHFQNRVYFNMKSEDKQFFKQKNKNIYRLPFAEDQSQMKKRDQKILQEYKSLVDAEPNQKLKKQIKQPITDKQSLQNQFQDRVKSFKQFAKILEKFFKKAILAKNLFNENLSFNKQFEEMKEFVQKYNVYSNQFDLKQQTQFRTRFSVGDSMNKLKMGMKLARNVFQLYETFDELPAYNNEDDPSVLENFMKEYKAYLIKLTTLFRDTFCTKYQQEQWILQFLFVGVRGCKEFSILYEIVPHGKHDTCQNLQDSFRSILTVQPLIKIQQQFIKQLNENINDVIEKTKQNNEEINEYLRFLKNLEEDDEAKSLIHSYNYKILRRKFLEMRTQHTSSPQQNLMSIYENFTQHKKLVEEKIRQLEDDEGEYSEQLNFKFLYQLSNMGHIILNLTRPSNVSADKFAFQRIDEIEVNRNKRSAQQFLVIQQAENAMEIFKYTKDVQSVLESYEVIIKNIPSIAYADQLHYLKSMANFCQMNGRVEQAIAIYQKALKICTGANLGKQYKEIKEILSRVPSEKEEKMTAYFNELRLKEIIDPEYDTKLKDIIKNIKHYYIEPYQHRQEMKQNN